MADNVAPRFTRQGFGGKEIPFYGLTFDKNGTCTSPKTRDAVITRINDEGFTDTILYSHGWNNDWDAAVSLYTRFIDGVGVMATQHSGELPPGIKPLFIGIAWPSAALVWPWEMGPDIAAAGIGKDDPDEPGNDPNELLTSDLELLMEDLGKEGSAELNSLSRGRETVTREEVDEIVAILAPQLSGGDAEEPGDVSVTAEDLAATFLCKELRPERETDNDDEDGFTSFRTADGTAENAQAAGTVGGLFGIRKVIRLATVLKMKDRAGVVGRAGVAETLGRILDETETRLHLVGHSYGTKVVMSALCQGPERRKATSALLLQPAVNHLAFSPDVNGFPGGFRKAIERVAKPVLVTHSKNDIPLRHIFQLAVRRKKDLGEEPQAAAGISRWAAMGGYGPKNLNVGETIEIALPDPGGPYPARGAQRVIGLDGTGKITGHSKVTNPFTFWAMIQNLA